MARVVLPAVFVGGAVSVIPTSTPTQPSETIDERIATLVTGGKGAGAHWPMREVSGNVIQEIINAPTLYDGVGSGLEYVDAGSLAQEDTGARCLGLATPPTTASRVRIAAAAHFQVPDGGWGLYFQPDEPATVTQPLLWQRSQSGDQSGGFYLFQNVSQGLTLGKRDATDTTIEISTPPNLLVPGVPNAVWCDWGLLGLRLFLNGNLVASDPAAVNWAYVLSADTTIGQHSWLTDQLDGLIGHAFFSDWQPSQAEIAAVSIPQGVTAYRGTDGGEVEVGQTKTIFPRTTGHFLGAITPSITQQGAYGTASVDGEEVDYLGVTDNPAADTVQVSVTDDRLTTPSRVNTFTVIPAGPGTGEYTITPELFGWSAANNNTVNTAAFQNALADASANAGSSSSGRGVVEISQGKRYTVRATNGSINNPNGCLVLPSNVEIRTAGQPEISSGDQGIIEFESWGGKSNYHNQVILLLDGGVSNIHLKNFQLDGRKNTMNDPNDLLYTQGQNGGVHNITQVNASDIVVQKLYNGFAVNDCWYLRTDGAFDPNTLVEDSVLTRGRRQGLSVIKLGIEGAGQDQFVMRRCVISDIGDYQGDIIGQQPAAGVDIEPNSSGQGVYGLTFDDCDITGIIGSVFSNGQTRGLSDGSALLGQAKSPMRWLRVLNTRMTGNRRGLQLKVRDDPVHRDCLVDGLVVTGSTNDDRIRLESAGNDGGTMIDYILNNPQIGAGGTGRIWVEGTLQNSGHLVTLYQGNFGATFDNPSGLTTFVTNSGFMP